MISFNFRSFKEEKPKHKQEIVFVNVENYTFLESAAIIEAVCTYHWIEVDDDGCSTGTGAGWTDGDIQEPNWVLGYYLTAGDIQVNASDITHWMSSDEYWEIIDSIKKDDQNEN